MILTEEMQKIMNLIQDDENNVFVTGKAGSGKTTFLKYLIEKSGKNCHSFWTHYTLRPTGKQIFRIQSRTIAQNGIADY